MNTGMRHTFGRRKASIIPNTFIGGSFSRSQLATRLGVTQQDIKGHQIINGQTIFRIDVDYSFVNNAFFEEILSFYIDKDGKATGSLGIGTFRVTIGNPLIYLLLPNIENIVDNFSNGQSNIDIFSTPNVLNIGSTLGNDGVFQLFSFSPKEIYVPIAQQTINGGSPDGDLVSAASNGATIYYNPSPVNKPSEVSDLALSNVGSVYSNISYTLPSSVNTIKYAFYFINNLFAYIGNINDQFLAKLVPNQENSVKIIMFDEFGNTSDFSNQFIVTTQALDADFNNAIAYYKLDETTGNAVDVLNGNNATLVGGVTQGVTGLINNAYDFNGSNGYLNIPLSIYDNLDTNNFTFSCWFKTDITGVRQTIVSDRLGSNFAERNIEIFLIETNLIRIAFGDDGNSIVRDSNFNYVNGTWCFIQFKYDALGDAELKINNVSEVTHTFVNAPNVQNQIKIGVRGDLVRYFDGIIDELAFFDGITSNTIDTNLYNNANGKTI